jgi:hypothetical protein
MTARKPLKRKTETEKTIRQKSGRSFKAGIAKAYDTLKALTDEGLSTATEDCRLSYGQMHVMVRDMLGMEPLEFVSLILAASQTANSRVTIHPVDAAKIGLMLHDRMYPMPDSKTRAKSAADNQFELEFAWDASVPGEGTVIDAEVEHVGTVRVSE